MNDIAFAEDISQRLLAAGFRPDEYTLSAFLKFAIHRRNVPEGLRAPASLGCLADPVRRSCPVNVPARRARSPPPLRRDAPPRRRRAADAGHGQPPVKAVRAHRERRPRQPRTSTCLAWCAVPPQSRASTRTHRIDGTAGARPVQLLHEDLPALKLQPDAISCTAFVDACRFASKATRPGPFDSRPLHLTPTPPTHPPPPPTHQTHLTFVSQGRQSVCTCACGVDRPRQARHGRMRRAVACSAPRSRLQRRWRPADRHGHSPLQVCEPPARHHRLKRHAHGVGLATRRSRLQRNGWAAPRLGGLQTCGVRLRGAQRSSCRACALEHLP